MIAALYPFSVVGKDRRALLDHRSHASPANPEICGAPKVLIPRAKSIRPPARSCLAPGPWTRKARRAMRAGRHGPFSQPCTFSQLLVKTGVRFSIIAAMPLPQIPRFAGPRRFLFLGRSQFALRQGPALRQDLGRAKRGAPCAQEGMAPSLSLVPFLSYW